MDILSIRKKGRRPAAAGTTKDTPIATETTATTETTTTTATARPDPPAQRSPPPDAVPPARRPTAPANETILDVALPPLPSLDMAIAPAAPATVVGDDDPLHGFLARYDVDEHGAERAAPKAVKVDTDDARRFLSFRLIDEDYAASIMDIREILTIRSLTEVPRAPREVLGVVSKRGVVLPVIDLATSLGLRAAERRLRASQRVLVVGDGDRVCGLRVDEVSEVIKLQHGQIEEVPASLGQKNAGLLLGLGRVAGRMYILLDVNSVLDAFAVSMGVAPSPRPEVE